MIPWARPRDLVPLPKWAAVPSIDHAAVAAEWLASLSQTVQTGHRSPRTVEAYRAAIKPWLHFLFQTSNARPSPATVMAFLADYRVGRKPATVNMALHAIRSCYAWAEAMIRYPAIARSIPGLRLHRNGPLPAPTVAEIAVLCHTAVTMSATGRKRSAREDLHRELIRLRNDALIRALYGTGVRLVSMARANIADLRLADQPPTLMHQSKGRLTPDTRAVLPPGAAQSLVAYLAERDRLGLVSPPLWIGLSSYSLGTRLDARSMRGVIVHAFEHMGMVSRDDMGHITMPGIFSAHSLRRSATAAVVDSNGLEAGQIFAGHASPTTTRQAYARVHAYRLLSKAAEHLDLPGSGEPPQP